MKYLTTILILFIVCSIACRDDDDTVQVEEIPVYITSGTEPEDVEPDYTKYAVDFYTSHPSLSYKPVEFETVTEQILVKVTHQQGAILETVTEKFLVQAAYRYVELYDSQTVYLVTDAEANSVEALTCYNFYPADEIIDTIVAPQYQTIEREVLVQQGTGAVVPAEYQTIVKKVVRTPGELTEIDSTNRSVERIDFNVPSHFSMSAYLQDQLAQQDIENCLEENAYKILN